MGEVSQSFHFVQYQPHNLPLGILQMVNIVIGDIVPLERLAIYRRRHAH